MGIISNTIISIVIILLLIIFIIYLFRKKFNKDNNNFKCQSNQDCNNGSCVDGKCKCDPNFKGDKCDVYDINNNNSNNCSLVPQKCNTDSDCLSCDSKEDYICEDSSQIKNPYNLTGKYCIPQKPKSGCNIQNGGVWVWSGWQNIEGMGWECQCQYPDAFGGPSCDESYMCLGGKFTPSKDGNPYNGICECKNINCQKDSDCLFGPCKSGICVGQKSGLSSSIKQKCLKDKDCIYGECINGICPDSPPVGYGVNPQCVPDACYPSGQWTAKNNIDGSCSCQKGYISNGYLCKSCDCETKCSIDSDCVSNNCYAGICLNQKPSLNKNNCEIAGCKDGQTWESSPEDCTKGICKDIRYIIITPNANILNFGYKDTNNNIKNYSITFTPGVWLGEGIVNLINSGLGGNITSSVENGIITFGIKNGKAVIGGQYQGNNIVNTYLIKNLGMDNYLETSSSISTQKIGKYYQLTKIINKNFNKFGINISSVGEGNLLGMDDVGKCSKWIIDNEARLIFLASDVNYVIDMNKKNNLILKKYINSNHNFKFMNNKIITDDGKLCAITNDINVKIGTGISMWNCSTATYNVLWNNF